MGGMNTFGGFGHEDFGTPEPKRKREDSEDIPKPFLRGGDGSAWWGAATGANAIGVKKIKMVSP